MIFYGEPLLGKVDNGSFLIWGKVGEVDPPQLVMPITIEPTKPRMCHDERFFNPWIKDYPIRLDCITDLSLYVFYGHFQTTFDEKSGFDLVHLHPSWSTFSGFRWAGWYFVYATLPFNWKANAYIYYSIGLGATNFIRLHGVPCSHYIDDNYIDNLVRCASSQARVIYISKALV